ncbi:MAG: hypothetical protein J0L92_20820 [Deltaproteobacteria bacterium]|nr:hypothetical protein [Deltaproteobacteria bacterium]
MLERIYKYPGCAVSSCGGISILVWTGEPTLAANQWAVRTLLSNRTKTAGEVTLLQIIAASAGTPDAETRAYIQDVYKRELSEVRRMVSAPLGDGFKQSVVRTIMRGMAVIAGKTQHITVVSTLDKAYDALLERRATPTRETLSSQVRAMFAELEAPPPE